MTYFSNKLISEEEAFWAMFYFLEKHYDLTDGQIMVGDILSNCEPFEDGNPADAAMFEDWNKAILRVKNEGKPPSKTLK